jgi:hypothetical protein
VIVRRARAAVVAVGCLLVACDKPPPPPATDAAPARPTMSAPPTTAAKSVLCFGAICAPGELCFDASHARDAATPYECFAAPKACGAQPSCDCLLENREFDCPAPNRLLCSDADAGPPQVVCVMIFE